MIYFSPRIMDSFSVFFFRTTAPTVDTSSAATRTKSAGVPIHTRGEKSATLFLLLFMFTPCSFLEFSNESDAVAACYVLLRDGMEMRQSVFEAG